MLREMGTEEIAKPAKTGSREFDALKKHFTRLLANLVRSTVDMVSSTFLPA